MQKSSNSVKRSCRLEGHLRHYHWGDPDLLPELLQRPNPEGRPFAEIWFGSHPEGAARVVPDGTPLPLWLAENGLPHPPLIKLLVARQPLSIQVHPDAEQAASGHAAGHFPDPSPKPELFYALRESWFLSGFRPLEEIEEILLQLAEIAPAWRRFLPLPSALRELYAELMALPQPEVDALLEPLLDHFQNRPLSPETPTFWLLLADRLYSTPRGRDRGLLSLFLLRLVLLRPGEVLYTPPRRLHALLRGAGVELMVCSDNVVRGGLTVKPVDRERLLEIASFETSPPLHPEPLSSEFLERFAAGGLALHRLCLPPGARHHLEGEGPKIGFLIQGEALLEGERLRRGEGFYLAGEVEIEALGRVELFYGSFA